MAGYIRGGVAAGRARGIIDKLNDNQAHVSPPPAQNMTQSSQPKGTTAVNWYDYIACFFAGMFLANVVPHFVHGISGDRFPTPFAHARGKGLSSPTVNLVWALLNLVVGYALFRVGRVSSGGDSALGTFFAGIAVMSTMLSVRFAKKQAK